MALEYGQQQSGNSALYPSRGENHSASGESDHLGSVESGHYGLDSNHPEGYVYKYFCNGNTIEKSVTLDLTNTYQGDCYLDTLYFGGSSPAPHQVVVEYRQVIVT